MKENWCLLKDYYMYVYRVLVCSLQFLGIMVNRKVFRQKVKIYLRIFMGCLNRELLVSVFKVVIYFVCGGFLMFGSYC